MRKWNGKQNKRATEEEEAAAVAEEHRLNVCECRAASAATATSATNAKQSAIMCDVEKAIKCNQSDDDHDELDEQQQQQQHVLAEQEQQERQQRQLSVVTDVRSNGSSRCFGQLLKLLLSSPGLVLLVTGYSVLGALIFPLLEAPQDLSKSAAIAKSREDCLRELWIITGESAGEK